MNKDVTRKKSLKVYYTNSRSIRNKIDALRGIVCVEEPDVIALSETWLNTSGRDFKTEFKIDGYHVYNKDREGRKGGGVAIYVKESLSSYVNTEISSDDSTETIWVEIINGRDKLLLGCIYRPPKVTRQKSNLIFNELRSAARHKNTLIMGDFNYRDIDWETNTSSCTESEEFINAVNDGFLKQLVRQPTKDNNILDLILTNNDNLVYNLEIGGKLSNSDHNEIRFNITWDSISRNCNNINIPDFRKANFTKLKRHLREKLYCNLSIREEGGHLGRGERSDGEGLNDPSIRGQEGSGRVSGVCQVINPSDESGKGQTGHVSGDRQVINPSDESGKGQIGEVDNDYNNFVNILASGQDKYIPYRKIRSNKNSPKWMTNNLKHLIGVKRSIYKKIKNGEVELRDRYNVLTRLVKRVTRKAKRDYELKIASNAKSDPKGFFQLYKAKSRERIGPLKVGNVLYDSSEDMSEVLNQYFVSVFTQETLTSIPEADPVFTGGTENELKDIKICRDDVVKEINKLSATKSPGVDLVYPKVIKECKDIVSLTLTNIFNKSLNTGEVPSLWKQANVVPIFKKGDRSVMSNYRPISLTSIVGKMLESIIARRIREHLNLYNLINESQHGFTKGKSCVTNLLSFYRSVFEATDNDDNYDIIYLDFSKAFDKVPHERLLRKIKAHGIVGKVLNWITSWLKNRTQRVVVNGEKSGWGSVTSGVPQGSVLGPLLFLIYINDLDNVVNSDISKFADDTKIGRRINSHQDSDQLQRDLDKMHEWTIKWQMNFNTSKCSILHIGRNNDAFGYTLDGVRLGKLDSVRDLGVIVSQDLRPREQCISARNKANRILGFIARSVTNKTAEVILKLYLALVRPHLDYAVQFWSPYYRMDINRLETIQRRMTKMIHGMRNLSYEDRLKRLNLHSLERRRVRGDMIEVFKWIKGFNKGDVSKVLIANEQNRTRSNGFKLKKFRFKKEIGRYWFTNRVVDEWNRLNEHVVGAESISCFKSRLDKFMDNSERW